MVARLSQMSGQFRD
ncbi:unnamed protein product [Linum tenue]|uniref:Uncharacterized protein n=1 Tax=Linum tenue TaxID=586396 RepID=A0AAV0Q0N8_9ROSI|nr:unnamed protein product [Linum tenue]